jgi:large subunit ribosomal protein L6
MSRIGKRAIKVVPEVKSEILGRTITITSDRGSISFDIPAELSISQNNGVIVCSRIKDDKRSRSLQGLFSRLITTRIADLGGGFKKKLEFKGTGYRARVEGDKLILNMGFSHEVSVAIPKGLNVNVVKNTIVCEGFDRSAVGDFAAKVREVRLPEVYKGKGIKYDFENIRRKTGKAAQTTGAK